MEEEKVVKRREGRTLLISNNDLNELSYEGLTNKHETNSGAVFLVFDSVDNASKAYEDLTNKNAKVKYSYYKIFFRLDDHDTSLDYDNLKKKVSDGLKGLIKELNILYFKFYTKDNKLIGSGDFTIDTKETLDALLTLKDVEIDGMSINFYRFRVKRNNHNQKNTRSN